MLDFRVHGHIQYPSDARYSARAFRTRAALVRHADCTRVASRLHAFRTPIARVSHSDCTRAARGLHACGTRLIWLRANAFVLMARGRMTRAAIAFTLVHHVCARLQGATCYAMTTPQLQAARLDFHDHASTTDLFGLL